MQTQDVIGLLNPGHLHLIVLPTEDCNFRCTYCYEDFKIGRMESATINAIKILINRRVQKLQSLTLSWFGGEPLIARDIVFDVGAYAQQACASKGVVFSSDMTTNGYALNEKTFGGLLNIGVRSFQISLDGLADEHDKTRKLASGKGTFNKIWSNLISMRASEGKFLVMLRVHLHGANFESVKMLLSEINSEFGGDARFTILLKNVGNWGGVGVQKMSLVTSMNPATDLSAYLEEIGWHKNRQGEQGPNTVRACYAALPNSFVIRADGSLSKCTVAFDDARNRVGRINEDGTLLISNESMQGFMRGLQSLRESELLCPIKEMPQKEEVIRIHKRSV